MRLTSSNLEPTGGWHFLKLTHSICTNWRLTIFIRMTASIWTSWEADNHSVRLTIPVWDICGGWHPCFEADMRLTIIFWDWHVSTWGLTIIFWGWHVSIWRLTWGWQLFLEADMFQPGGWHSCFEADMGLACLNRKAGNYFLRLTISIWTNWEADNFFSEADHFNLNQLEADNYFLRLTWGWHGADIHFLRLTCFNLEADTFHFEPTGGWQLFFEADTSQSEPTLGLTILFSKSEPFQPGPSERLSILTAQFDLSWFFSSLNLTISVFSFLDHFVSEPVAICLNLNTGCFSPDCLKLAWF